MNLIKQKLIMEETPGHRRYQTEQGASCPRCSPVSRLWTAAGLGTPSHVEPVDLYSGTAVGGWSPSPPLHKSSSYRGSDLTMTQQFTPAAGVNDSGLATSPSHEKKNPKKTQQHESLTAELTGNTLVSQQGINTTLTRHRVHCFSIFICLIETNLLLTFG